MGAASSESRSAPTDILTRRSFWDSLGQISQNHSKSWYTSRSSAFSWRASYGMVYQPNTLGLLSRYRGRLLHTVAPISHPQFIYFSPTRRMSRSCSTFSKPSSLPFGPDLVRLMVRNLAPKISLGNIKRSWIKSFSISFFTRYLGSLRSLVRPEKRNIAVILSVDPVLFTSSISKRIKI